MSERYDALVIGGGFKGMMTAYGLRARDMSVCLVEKGRQLGGFMSPMPWRGVEVDKGPQYLDGISAAHKDILDDIMDGSEPLTSLDYSYASFWNGTYTDGFALPDYRSLPVEQRALVLYETLNRTAEPGQAATIADLYGRDESHSYAYIDRWCRKFLGIEASRLSPLNRNFVTFFGRKLLLDNELSVQLKQHPRLDATLAAAKKSIDHGTHNLYPLGRNLGYFRQAFDDRLHAMGVAVRTDTDVTGIEHRHDGYRIVTGAGSVHAGAVYCAATIESTEHLLLGSSRMADHIQPVAQLFYLLELDREQQLPFYVMNYTDSSVTRVTNFTAYGNRGSDGKTILCAEVPAAIGSALWNDPEAHVPTLLEEIAAMGVDSEAVSAHQAFRVPSTYRATLQGYEDRLDEVSAQIAEIHGDGIHVLTPHLLTRASIMADLSARGILP